MDNELWRWVWTIGAVVLTTGEIITAGFFVVPFAIGSVLAAIVAWVDGPGWLQWVLFFGGSTVSMVVVRRMVRRQDDEDEDSLPVGVYRYIGMKAVVLEAIDPVLNTGQVRVQTEEWRATVAGPNIAEGEIVTVVGLQGARLLVELSDDSSDSPDSSNNPASATDSPASNPSEAPRS